ncbi:MAG: hypothetical protein LBL07_13100 [Tannerella sp.]|jgi:hypothetical protein|nr:hypothetical protein [Tannerella sp.]
MKESIKTTIKRWVNLPTNPLRRKMETMLLAQGSLLSNQQNFISSGNINDYEFKIFSQRGEDGIIQYLIKHAPIKNKVFIEFGVENYMESNTRFLMMNNNWSGLVLDGSRENIGSLKKREWFWKYDLKTKCAFIDRDNINTLLHEDGFEDIGILSIDIDGNDYWIFQKLDLSKLNPSIVIIEYNGLFGSERAISVPYDKYFNRTKAHYSNLFFGASLAALVHLATQKGYELVACCDAGTNAFFVQKDLLNDKIRKLSVSEAYKEDKCRQSRDKRYRLSFLSGNERLSAIKGLDVVNVLTGKIEQL